MSEVLLLLAGLIGGAVNSLAGGGSFIVFPALLFAGVTPVIANATNTYAALPGYVGGTVGFWKSIRQHRSILLYYTIVSLIFGYLGAELLLVVSDEQFALVVPWLMVFAVVLFIFGDRISSFLARRAGRRASLKYIGAALMFLFLAAVCAYGGFFNAGLGILLLAFLTTAGLKDIHAMNGIKLWVSSLVALVSVGRFALSGSIDWYNGSIALVGVVVGGYLAARNAHLVPARLIRIGVVAYGITMSGYFFWVAYL